MSFGGCIVAASDSFFPGPTGAALHLPWSFAASPTVVPMRFPSGNLCPREASSVEGEWTRLEEDSHLRHLLLLAQAAVDSGDLAHALRLTDRAWRHAPASAEIAALLGRLLLVTGEASAALSPLRQAVRLQHCPDYAAALILGLLKMKNYAEADRALCEALRRYAVTVDGALARATARAMKEIGGSAPGWVGIAPDLAIIGELSAGCSDVCVYVRTESGRVWCQGLAEHTAQRPRFRIPAIVADGRPRTLAVEAAGASLLGSPIQFPPDFGLDGRASAVDGCLQGWISMDWMPEASLEVTIEDEEGSRIYLSTKPDPAQPHRHAFTQLLAECNLRGPRLWTSARLPNGIAERFPDAPLLLDPRLPSDSLTDHVRMRGLTGGDSSSSRPVDIIVPVYRGHDETLRCLRALLPSRHVGVEIVVVDDASPEPELTAALQALAAEGEIRLLRNPLNLGFPGSVNKALAVHPERDAVIVNADAVVHGDWLDRLRTAAYSAPDVATATPLSNHGSIVTYPSGAEIDCTLDEAAVLDGLAAAVNRRITADIPVGVGFCMYLRRDCLDEVGAFDEYTFGKGYGEENDLCLRARFCGWRHVVAADVFVLHLGGVSFGRRRDALLERSRRIINTRYPGYDAIIDSFVRADPLLPLRRRLDEERVVLNSRPCALLLSLALPGGVDRVVRKRCKVLARAGLRPILLRPEKPGSRRCLLSVDDEALRDLSYDIPADLTSLTNLLKRLNVMHVELHHFLDLDPTVIEVMRSLKVHYDVYIHDYSWICPRLTLLGGDNRYCGEPELAECEACIKVHGGSLRDDLSVSALRARSSQWLRTARRIIVPSADTLRRMRRYFPKVKIKCRPWEPLIRFSATATTPVLTQPVRVVVIGAIGAHKGFHVLLNCAKDAAERELAIEFVVIGYTEDDNLLLSAGNVFVTGRYAETEVQDLLRREHPHLALFPSVWPETWCFALTHALRAGLPVVAFDIGAIAERLRNTNLGTLLPLGTEPRVLNDQLLRIAGGRRPLPEADMVADIPVAAGDLKWDHTSIKGGLLMMAGKKPFSEAPQSALAATAKAITLNQGLYLFYVQSAAPVRATAASENVTLPAVQVGLAPGVVAEHVDFISGPHTKGTWLCEPGNMIVAKISGGPATLIVTSISHAGGQPLAIEVERLDGRSMADDPDTKTTNASTHSPLRSLPLPGNGQRVAIATPLQPESRPTDIRCEILVHVKNQGDLSFVDSLWAGCVGEHLWIENFSIKPLDGIAAADIEYKGLTISGFETPWTIGGQACGTRQMATPLIAFALRMRSKDGSAVPYDCEYSGCFQSGTVVGPVTNGTPCRSSVPNDPLEGIQVRFLARKLPVTRSLGAAPRKSAIGPRFSKLREESSYPSRPSPAGSAAELVINRPKGEFVMTGDPVSVEGENSTQADARESASLDDAGSEAAPTSRAVLMKRVLPFLSR